MFWNRKKYFLFTYGSYFWGYKYDLIKAKTEADAVNKFLYTHQLELKFENENPHNKKYNFSSNWKVKEIEVK